jgi:hypothetical protein
MHHYGLRGRSVEVDQEMSGMWQEKRMVWFRGEQIVVNVRWVVAMTVQEISGSTNFKLMVRTIDGGYWKLAEGYRQDMTRLMNDLIR